MRMDARLFHCDMAVGGNFDGIRRMRLLEQGFVLRLYNDRCGDKLHAIARQVHP
ncbi:MAG: hypothetical protein RRZ24_02710 [Clostridia bacterium]